MVVHFALVPLFINPRDGLLVTSGLMSADFARELRASYGRSSCIVAITLNAGAYVSEIFRAGIQSIDKGRWRLPRAGHAVVENHAQGDPAAGVSPYSAAAGQTPSPLSKTRRWPRRWRRSGAAHVSGAYATYWEPYLTISGLLVITFLLAQLVNRLEKRFGKSDSHNLHKRFGDSHVLRGISCDIKPQEVVCIIGPSGSGKAPSCAA